MSLRCLVRCLRRQLQYRDGPFQGLFFAARTKKVPVPAILDTGAFDSSSSTFRTLGRVFYNSPVLFLEFSRVTPLSH